MTATTLLSVREVTAAYGRGRGAVPVLRGVTLPDLRGGEVTALVGPNAAGKSTLFRRVAGLMPGGGEVRVDGASVAALPPGDARRPVYLPQEAGGGSDAALSVFDAVLLALKGGGGRGAAGWRVSDAEADAVTGALATLGVADLARRGLSELSGGQRQVVSLAGALVREPRVLLLDEPTSALDLRRASEAMATLRRVARERGTLVVVALHDLNAALRAADRVAVLRPGGTVAAHGAPGEVLTPALLREVYGVEARVERCSRGLPFVVVDGAARDDVTDDATAAAWETRAAA